MPHVIVKIGAGHTDAEKSAIAAALAAALVASAGCSVDAVSVAIEDVDQRDWIDAVYRPEIIKKSATLYKKPGYDPFEVNPI